LQGRKIRPWTEFRSLCYGEEDFSSGKQFSNDGVDGNHSLPLSDQTIVQDTAKLSKENPIQADEPHTSINRTSTISTLSSEVSLQSSDGYILGMTRKVLEDFAASHGQAETAEMIVNMRRILDDFAKKQHEPDATNPTPTDQSTWTNRYLVVVKTTGDASTRLVEPR
jgi:hypothetical protein